MGGAMRVSRADAGFQQWEALLRNRNKRQRARAFLVQGVRPINLAHEHGWRLPTLIYDAERPLSTWARAMLRRAEGDTVAMAPHLLRRLSDKEQEVPELVAVADMPADDLSRITVAPSFLGVAFDRPALPGNIGTLLRSVDAFGGAGTIITGHAADPYDPKAVRASTGSLFALPTVRTPSPHQVLAWRDALHAEGRRFTVIGTDENGTHDIADLDLTTPTLLVIGNETSGLSAAWRTGCDLIARIPIGGAASSLNAASAATVALYEAARQRRRSG